MSYFLNKQGEIIIRNLIDTIIKNKEYLSEIDGAIGDGDHGINLNKGFTKFKNNKFNPEDDFSISLEKLGSVLMMEIGGSMGPLYGNFFMKMSQEIKGKEKIDKKTFGKMLNEGVEAIQILGNASLGDKTILDTLIPAQKAFKEAINNKKKFSEALKGLKEAAERGKNSTKEMVAKVGRASRLGERSRGVLDAGATSCNLILQSMADSIIPLLKEFDTN